MGGDRLEAVAVGPLAAQNRKNAQMTGATLRKYSVAHYSQTQTWAGPCVWAPYTIPVLPFLTHISSREIFDTLTKLNYLKSNYHIYIYVLVGLTLHIKANFVPFLFIENLHDVFVVIWKYNIRLYLESVLKNVFENHYLIFCEIKFCFENIF